MISFSRLPGSVQLRLEFLQAKRWAVGDFHQNCIYKEIQGLSQKQILDRLFLPGEDGHGLLDVDGDAGVPRLSAVIQKVVTRKHLLPAGRAFDVTKI